MYNRGMKTQEKYQRKLTKKQIIARRKRQAQVRRQKIILALILLCIPLILLLIFLPREEEPKLLTINDTCESYRPQVEQVAARYQMSEYVDLILALMMQESSGVGPDVLQSSEGAYNTKYPQTPNAITDVSYSIECGIQELKYSMEKAQVQSPTDIKRIELALQGYNFGADPYFEFMEEHRESSWSHDSAKDFAKMASGGVERSEGDPFRETAGPWAYGDQYYPEHVLRYYHPEELLETDEN